MPDDWATLGADLHLAITRPGVRASLERSLRDAVQGGRLAPGARLPSSRALAQDLGIARNTVAEVYDQLTAEGWLAARPGSGTSVSTHTGAPADPPPEPRARPRPAAPRFDLRPGNPNVVAFPRGAWLAAARTALLTAPPDALGYGHRSGRPELRSELAAYLGRVRAVRATADRIVVSGGTIHAFSMICAALKRRGARTVAFEAYVWRDLVDTAAAQGLGAVPIGVDAGGARVDELYGTDADAVLLTPSHQFPTGHTLSPDRRRQVTQWARATGALVVEDDYDGEFRYDRQPVGSLQELAPDRVAYLGTTSKSLAPGLRLGWAVLPAELVDDVAAVKFATVRQTGVIDQLTLAELLRSGGYDRHVRRSRLTYRRRRDRLVAALAARAPEVEVKGIAAGLHAVLQLPARLAGSLVDADVVDRAARHGVAVHPLSAYRIAPEQRPRTSLVIGYGTPADSAFEPALEALLGVLADCDRT
jgi:GntR family transcriptional regulator / MocR family aminotransferase